MRCIKAHSRVRACCAPFHDSICNIMWRFRYQTVIIFIGNIHRLEETA